MSTLEFFDLLKQHQEKPLLFEYASGLLVGANYHITEVKHLQIDAVDCGAGIDSWNETIIQLWESPKEIGKTDFMQTSKALSILKKVDRMKAYHWEAEVKFEYGNFDFYTTQYFIAGYIIKNGNLLVKLSVHPTKCKAEETSDVASSPEVPVNSCAPKSGCC